MTRYVLRYFPVAARAETSKVILSLSGANWKNEYPAWPEDKDAQPAGKLPVLMEYSGTDDDNATPSFVLGESSAIEQYLATKLNFYFQPDNLEVVARQNELRSHIRDLFETVSLIKHAPNSETKQAFETTFKNIAAYIIKSHSKALKDNGSNGHYFGSSITYIDVALFANIYVFRSKFFDLNPELVDLFSAKNAPEINKVYEAVLANASLASYAA